MDQLIRTLPAILKASGHSSEVVEAAAIAAWKHVAGAALRTQAVARDLNGKTLVVAVADAIWKKQLESMSGQLLFRLNSTLGQPVVKRLEFYIDARLLAGMVTAPPTDKNDAGENEKEFSFELLSAAGAIQDNQLRKTFLATARSNMRRREQKH